MMYKPTTIIDAAFTDEDIHHSVEQRGDIESVCAGFAVKKGPLVTIRFISRDDDNDVAVRVMSLLNDIPEKERIRVLKVINEINCAVRYAKFCLDDDGDLNVEMDVPVKCSDDCLGKVACELFYRTMQIVRDKYELIARALYAEDEEEAGEDTPDMSSFAEFLRHYQMESDDDSEEADTGDSDHDEGETDTDDFDDESDA